MKLLLKFSFLIILFTNSNLLAFGLNHFQILAGVHKGNMSYKESLIAYKNLQYASAALDFLDCPFELIDKQYNGIESVIQGGKYLAAYFTNPKTTPFQEIMLECKKELNRYHAGVDAGTIKSRAVSDGEIQAFMAELSNKNISASEQMLAGLVTNLVNLDTLCYSKNINAKLALGIGGSVGVSRVECFTPTGRHFILRGPSLGFGFGFMSALKLANSSLLPSAPSWSFKLYEKNYEQRWSHESNKNASLGFVIGASTDVKTPFSPMRYNYDIQPLVGGGFMSENMQSFYVKRSSFPLYYGLNQVINLKDFVAGLHHIDLN